MKFLFEDKTPSTDDELSDNDNSYTLEINMATAEEISQLPGFNMELANKIISLRKSGIYIHSLDDLYEKLDLNSEDIEIIKENVIPKNEEIVFKNRIVDL